MRPAPFRLARGSVVAVVGVALALVGHGVAGGAVAPDAGTVLPATAALVGCVVAARHAWTPGRLVAALLAVQVVVHGSLWLTTAGGPAVDPRLAGLVTPGAAHHHATAAALSPGMLAAHAIALVVAAVLLARVDDAVLRTWALGRAVIGALSAATGPVPDAAVVRATPARSLRRTRVLLGSPRRGPPRLLAPC